MKIALKSIRNIMEENCSHYHISDECVIYVKDIIENLIEEITKEAIVEFDRLNNNREKQGLRRLKRLNSWSIIKSTDKVLKNLNHPNMGSQPAMIGNPDGEKMLQSKPVIKLDTDTWATGGTDEKR